MSTHPIPSPNSEMVERLMLMADQGDFGRKPDPSDIRRRAATLIEHLEHEKAELQHDLTRARQSLDAEVNARIEAERQLEVAREALAGIVKAVEMDSVDGISGFTGARLSDARQALSNISGEGKKTA